MLPEDNNNDDDWGFKQNESQDGGRGLQQASDSVIDVSRNNTVIEIPVDDYNFDLQNSNVTIKVKANYNSQRQNDYSRIDSQDDIYASQDDDIQNLVSSMRQSIDKALIKYDELKQSIKDTNQLISLNQSHIMLMDDQGGLGNSRSKISIHPSQQLRSSKIQTINIQLRARDLNNQTVVLQETPENFADSKFDQKQSYQSKQRYLLTRTPNRDSMNGSSGIVDKINKIYLGGGNEDTRHSRNYMSMLDDMDQNKSTNQSSISKPNLHSNQRINQTIDYGNSSRLINNDSSLLSLNKNQRQKNSMGNLSVMGNVRNRLNSQRLRPLLKKNFIIKSDDEQSSPPMSDQKRQFERIKHSDSIVELLKYNLELKTQMATIVDEISSKLTRAKERRKNEHIQHNTEIAADLKQKDQQMKAKNGHKSNLKKEIDLFQAKLDELHDIHKVDQMQNILKDKAQVLQNLKQEFEYSTQVKTRQEKALLKQEKNEDQDKNVKSKFFQQFKVQSKEMRELRKMYRELQTKIMDQHAEILRKENDSKKLMKAIKDKKSGNIQIRTQDEIETKKYLIDKLQQEVNEAKKQREQKQRGLEREFQDLDQKIKNTQYEIKVIELKDKDQDNQLKLVFLRQRELEKQIAEYRKLQRAKARKEKNQTLTLPQPIEDLQSFRAASELDTKDNTSDILRIHDQDSLRKQNAKQAPVKPSDDTTFFNLTQLDEEVESGEIGDEEIDKIIEDLKKPEIKQNLETKKAKERQDQEQARANAQRRLERSIKPDRTRNEAEQKQYNNISNIKPNIQSRNQKSKNEEEYESRADQNVNDSPNSFFLTDDQTIEINLQSDKRNTKAIRKVT
ncbi:UNKNOWN [Stylonychia lemnae]|uniref:Lebercilin domain-containing protein n=1 Tax=Stylonychia lemnae TaxID=5949 RepID=A0A078AMD6_STYLE|nr:UNKNOWN [Stylonychia lemnae]|eukprot:CDW82013.1 UNKNOWN [Stylonychia lemnae]